MCVHSKDQKKPRPKDFYHDYLAEQMLDGKTKPDKV